MRLSRYASLALLQLVFLCSSLNGHSVKRNPLESLTTIDKAVIHTPSHRVHCLSSFDLTFVLHSEQRQIKLKLSPNHDVIAEGATVHYLTKDGRVHRTEVIDRTEHRVFMGRTYIQHRPAGEWTNAGWARIVVHQDGPSPIFEGAFRLDGDHHHIQTRDNYEKTKHGLDPIVGNEDNDAMIVWRDSDVQDNESPVLVQRELVGGTCGADELTFNLESRSIGSSPLLEDSGFLGSSLANSLSKRQRGSRSLVSTIGDSSGCPTTKQVALLGLATDCTYTADFSSTAALRANVIAQINTASVQYEDSFNISLGIRNLTISDPICPATPPASALWNLDCSSTVSISDRLTLFSTWRGQNPDQNAFWTLLSTCNTGSAVGLAWLGQACITTATNNANTGDVVSSTNVVVRTGAEWQVIAHEVGHTFGAVHDCVASTCADGSSTSGQCCPLSATTCDAGGAYIMNPASGRNNNVFSPCTVGNVCSRIGNSRVRTSCLTTNRNISTINGSVCGNGIVELDEDCDCGGTEGCGANSCCDPTTCKFKGNAVCDNSNDACCTSSCQFASSSTICRPSTGNCDPAETCSGSAATCPADRFATNGNSCGNSTDLYCASGECTSRDLQCRTLMGSDTDTNYTAACLQSSCQVSCTTSTTSNSCTQFQQFFIDGTSCGSGNGRCSNGVCRSSSTTGGGGGGGGGNNTSGTWASRNLGLVIGVSVGGALFVVLIIGTLCYRRHVRKKMIIEAQVASMPPMGMMYPPVIYR